MILFTLCANHGFALFHFAQIDPILIYTCDDERKAIFFCVSSLSLSLSTRACVRVCLCNVCDEWQIQYFIRSATTYTAKYIHSIEAISFACDQCTKSHLFLARYARICECERVRACVCLWNFIGRFVELCTVLGCVLCHVMSWSLILTSIHMNQSLVWMRSPCIGFHERVDSYL